MTALRALLARKIERILAALGRPESVDPAALRRVRGGLMHRAEGRWSWAYGGDHRGGAYVGSARPMAEVVRRPVLVDVDDHTPNVPPPHHLDPVVDRATVVPPGADFGLPDPADPKKVAWYDAEGAAIAPDPAASELRAEIAALSL